MEKVKEDIVHNPYHAKVYHRLQSFLSTKSVPHIIFHGVPGSGKTHILRWFLNEVYRGDKQKMKSHVMFVNCAQEKGINFIREDVKYFAETLTDRHENVPFKSIVMKNGEFITSEAQSALRRCVEANSNTTRFFMIVENKQRMLHPILSRFCDIYVPEFTQTDNAILNFHKRVYSVPQHLRSTQENAMFSQLRLFLEQVAEETPNLSPTVTAKFVETNTVSCKRLIEHIELLNDNGVTTDEMIERAIKPDYDEAVYVNVVFEYYRVKSEYRNEKLLMYYVLHYLLTIS